MNRASPVDMRKALEIVQALKDAGILFVPIPVLNEAQQVHLNKILHDALMEIERVCKGKSFVQVDCYENEQEKKLFLDWVLTAETHGYPNEWFEIFKKAKYSGDWFWTKV